ncbi:PAP2 superfamily protein [Novipirellula galeiformis]|uniref:PAP2 superfamily protein n=1 Tax=Novipirellula galeiformis TaxID=2528004 RepID=A0A5C6CAP9_9BACT|nr:hypothetical protein [Novipirellula galeiformis]TWU21162.1 PAP2 superfamily protein [Novipirellula galeiformis]
MKIAFHRPLLLSLGLQGWALQGWIAAALLVVFLPVNAWGQFLDPPPDADWLALTSPTDESLRGSPLAFAPNCPPLCNDSGGMDSSFIDSGFIETDAEQTQTRLTPRATIWNRVVSDHRNYYDLRSFQLLGGGFLIGAAVANTQLDEELHRHFQTSVGGATSDDWSEFLHADKELGNGLYTLPIFATAWAAGAYFDESAVLTTAGRWGERSLRSFWVGAPPLILAQRLTGGSRPSEKDRGSRWLPFQDNNGVSGHAFMSALPFLNAAKMTERPLLKATFFAGSLLGPLSRVNDDAHYPSQVALGWWMAYVAASAIDRSEGAASNLQVYPYVADGGYGGMLEWRF